MSEATLGVRRSWLERVWGGIADRGRAYIGTPNPSGPAVDRAKALADALASSRGEASGAALARDLMTVVAELDDAGRIGFGRYLATGFAPDEGRLSEAARAYLEAPGAEAAMRLFTQAEPPRQELLRRMNSAPGGTAALVGLRRDLLPYLTQYPELHTLDSDLRHLFTSWFNRGFLELHRIDWHTPAAILEKLIAYEAVHEIQGWEDLRRRLAPDRRAFAFFHRALPGEPLIFVEVALVRGLSDAIGPLLAPDAAPAPPSGFDTAIFYSISNCQEGLRGISFGNFLIKQVVEELKAELPALTRFATLSPVPGFRLWLGRRADADSPALQELIGAAEDRTEALSNLFAGEWWQDAALVERARQPLLRLAAEYLTRSARGMRGIDPVARFHLGNGARLERINFLGNPSARGMRESFGIMVNYLYDRDTIERNHEAFVRSGQVARAGSVDTLLGATDTTRGLLRSLKI
jgi:malonyl-CoA decarboxylase